MKNIDRPNKNEKLEEEIINIFKENKGRYGYRRIKYALLNEQGIIANHKLIRRIMKKYDLIYHPRRKRKWTSYMGTVGNIAPNILDRNFEANSPYQKWATDITEFKIGNSKLYLSPMIDLFNEEIVAYSISTSPNMNLVLDMLEKAFKKLPKGAHPIIHSDQGFHYQNREYQRRLKHRGCIQSMSRKGNCLDNSVMENFFGRLKMETVYLYKVHSLPKLIDEVREYIDYYNYDRVKQKLNGLSPIDYRQRYYEHLS